MKPKYPMIEAILGSRKLSAIESLSKEDFIAILEVIVEKLYD